MSRFHREQMDRDILRHLYRAQQRAREGRACALKAGKPQAKARREACSALFRAGSSETKEETVERAWGLLMRYPGRYPEGRTAAVLAGNMGNCGDALSRDAMIARGRAAAWPGRL